MSTETLFDFNASDVARVTAQRDAQRPSSPGLVPSKTSLQGLFINTSPSACAERRVKRLKKSVWASGHLHAMHDMGHRPPVCWFVTLTYADAHGWRADHVSKAVQAFRNWCRARRVPCRYTWVAEIQPQRMARTGEAVVHYHLLAWLPRGVSMPQWDRSDGRRAAFWSHGMTNTQVARAGVGYLMKYLSKLGELTRFPKGLRLYGIGGLNSDGKAVRNWYNLPEWCKAEFGVGEVFRRAGRLVVRETGELLQPAYAVVRAESGLLVQQLRPVAQRFHDGAYSRWTAA